MIILRVFLSLQCSNKRLTKTIEVHPECVASKSIKNDNYAYVCDYCQFSFSNINSFINFFYFTENKRSITINKGLIFINISVILSLKYFLKLYRKKINYVYNIVEKII